MLKIRLLQMIQLVDKFELYIFIVLKNSVTYSGLFQFENLNVKILHKGYLVVENKIKK